MPEPTINRKMSSELKDVIFQRLIEEYPCKELKDCLIDAHHSKKDKFYLRFFVDGLTRAISRRKDRLGIVCSAASDVLDTKITDKKWKTGNFRVTLTSLLDVAISKDRACDEFTKSQISRLVRKAMIWHEKDEVVPKVGSSNIVRLVKYANLNLKDLDETIARTYVKNLLRTRQRIHTNELYLLSRWPSLHDDTQINTLLKQILLDALNKKISSKGSNRMTTNLQLIVYILVNNKPPSNESSTWDIFVRKDKELNLEIFEAYLKDRFTERPWNSLRKMPEYVITRISLKSLIYITKITPTLKCTFDNYDIRSNTGMFVNPITAFLIL